MKFLFSAVLFISLLGASASANAQVKKETEADTVVYILDGTVKTRFGVFSEIALLNSEELEEWPMEKLALEVMTYVDKKTADGQVRGWVSVCKAEVYRLKIKDEVVEIKLLEDFGEQAMKKGLGSDQKLTPGNKVRLRWVAKEY